MKRFSPGLHLSLSTTLMLGKLEIEVFEESFKFKLKLKGNEGEEFEKLLLIWLIDWGGLGEEIIFKTSEETPESPSGENSS